MPDTNISVDEYLSERKHCADDGVIYKAMVAPKTYNAEQRSCRFTMSSQELDRDEDIVVTRGIDLTHFEKNPIALMNHRSDMVIGAWSDVSKRPKALEGTVNLAAEGTAPYIDQLAALMGQGFVRAASIGFRIRTLKRREMEGGQPIRGYIIEESDLLECSVVSIPANAMALAKAAKEGHGIATEYLEHVLDSWTRTAEGLIVPREDIEAAHKEATGNKTTVATLNLSVDSDQAQEVIKDFTDQIETALDQAVSNFQKAVRVSVDEQKAVENPSDDVQAGDEPVETPEPVGKTTAKDAQEPSEAEETLFRKIGAFFGLKRPEPPAKADPDAVAALKERAKAIREAHKAA